MKHLRYHIIFCLLLFHGSAKAQTNGFFLHSGIGYAVNPTLDINGRNTKNNGGLLFDLGSYYRFTIRKKVFAETGLAGRFIFAHGQIGNLSFTAQTIRLQMPLKIGYQISPRWNLALGASFQNNKDVLKSDFREPYFWRANLITEGKYFWKERCFISGSLNYEVRNVPEGYLLNDPKMGLLLGLSWRLSSKK